VVRHLKARAMENKQGGLTVLASAPADLSAGIILNNPQNSNLPSRAGVVEGRNSVFVEFVRKSHPCPLRNQKPFCGSCPVWSKFSLCN
jgi:hypothetical protein